MKLFKFSALSFFIAFLSGIVGAFFAANVLGLNDGVFTKLIEKRVYVEESQVIGAIEKVSPSVVSIMIARDVAVFDEEDYALDAMKLQYAEVSGGSGFIVSEKGLVLTNKHLIKAGSGVDYKVVMYDGTEYKAEILNADLFEDVAILQIIPNYEGENIDFVVPEFADSDELKIGQKVLALGNALAEYENTVTLGIVSALGRNISAYYGETGDDYETFYGLIQTDAAINYGNSGGPLVNLQGQIVAMSVAFEELAYGISFAVPINDLKPVIYSIESVGEIVRPILGVKFYMLNESQAKEFDEFLSYGALISEDLDGGEFEHVLLEQDDIILSLDGEKVNKNNPLNSLIKKYSPGEMVNLMIWRKGDIFFADFKLMSSKDFE